MKTSGRFAIVDLMAATVILACDLAAIRSLSSPTRIPYTSHDRFSLLVVPAMPMVGLLGFGAWLQVRWGRGKTAGPPFLIGFEVVGWCVTAAYLALAAQEPHWVDTYLRSVRFSMLPYGDFVGSTVAAPDWLKMVVYLVQFLPVLGQQLGAAVIGGAFTARYRVRLMIERRGARSEPARGGDDQPECLA